jgi:16S rRNA (cytosine967-C5)-methyltransferase
LAISPAQFEHSIAALRAVLRFDHPADAVLSRYFREHRALGHNDRAFVAGAVFGVLRHKRLLDHVTGREPGGNARQLLLAWLARVEKRNTRELAPLLRHVEAAKIAAIKAAALDGLTLAQRAELPDWVVERLQPGLDDATLLALGQALARPAPLDLRVNTLRATREQAQAALAVDGIDAAPTPYAPNGLRVAGHPAINRHAWFVNGALEVQDEGSQILCHLLAPTRHDLVIDFCAGAGGKTLALGALMGNRGRLYAFDVSAARLRKLTPRLARSGLSNVHPLAITSENDLKVKRFAGKADRVLVDAPCSGLGTLRRNPDLKWRQSPQSVAELAVKQTAILAAAARLLKPGGRLVYATCSLLAQENEAIVEAFLAAHPTFHLIDCDEVLAQQRIPLTTGKTLRLAPQQHGTDGFLGAILTRE